jgi:dTDP-4-dehydrorhamnose reductase
MNILITGANGQLGNELRTVITTGAADLGPIPAAYHGATVHYANKATLDITNAAACDAFIAANNIDLIINCAAYTNVDGCESNEELAYLVNATGPGNLARAAEHNGATLIHISTDYVFKGDDPTPRTEGDPCDPQSVYGKSKLAGEQAVAESCSRHFIVRTAWLYGHTGPNFVLTMLRLARENGAIKVVSDQHGNPTYANDVAHVLLQLALTQAYGIYHCTNHGTCSWFDLASLAVDLAGIPCAKTPCTTAEFPRPAPRPAWSVLGNAHLQQTTGDPMRPWQQALQAYVHKMSPRTNPMSPRT